VASAIANGTLVARQRLGQQRLAAAGRPEQQDVGLLQLDVQSSACIICTRL
jgi:hypothetical protein